MMAPRDLAELVRAPAALSVPGDVIAGAAAGQALSGRTLGLACSSVCLYWAGMAANDWADRRIDAVERPDRPIPSGRVRPEAALAVAAGLTVAGIGTAGLAGGRRALTVAVPLAVAVWGYDLIAKHTPAGPLAMALCRGLDVLLGATPGRSPADALPAALTIAAHTYLLTALSRGEVSGTTRTLPAATLTGTVALAATTAFQPFSRDSAAGRRVPRSRASAAVSGLKAGGFRPGGRRRRAPTWKPAAGGAGSGRGADVGGPPPGSSEGWVSAGLALWYAGQFGAPQAHAAAEPSADRVRAAVTAGIVGLPALQGALAARAGAVRAGLAVALAVPLARRLARKLSPT
ncbi:SCO3242 family prenyltransferase [Nonomuraea sp. NPDC046802]|uniref:SCO3242 family prenyltransferase n=1 Tax=Nonomuraea sp. NPDC046802 TaxID=3154919 RepID=UPI0033E83A1D